ncbi:MAG: hypothetical protein Wins2KO_29730 [Winogradskyella sp.]
MKAIKNIFLILCITSLFTSCSKDDENNTDDFDGSIDSIENFYTPELLAALEDLGFTFNVGDNPPMINGTYLADAVTLQSSNIAQDNIGNTYSDITLIFSNQNNQTLSLDFLGYENNSVIESIETYVSGTDDDFNVFLKVESTRNEHTTLLAYAISGTMTTDGIINYQLVLIMLDDNGDPENNLIENNQGRLFVESDALCEFIDPDSRQNIDTNHRQNEITTTSN